MARKRKSRGRNVDCEAEVMGIRYWDFFLGCVSDEEKEVMRELWKHCGHLILEIDPPNNEKIWAFREFGWPD